MSTWLPTRASGFVLCLLAGFAILPSYAETQDAEDLIRNLNRNVAYIGRCLQTSGLKPVSGKHKALYQTLKATSRAIDDLRAAAQARDKEFFRALNRMDQRVAELGLAYKASGWSNADITRAIDRLGKIMDLLQDNCSQVALRSKRHPEISAAEREAYGKMQAQVTVLKARLDRMKSQPPRGLRDLYYIESLVRISRLLDGFNRREITLDDYVRDVARYNRAYNHWIGWAGYWSHYHPDCASAFVEAGPTWTALYDTYLSMASKPTWLVTDWSWLDQSVNIDASINVGISEAEVARYEAYLENLPDAPIDASLTDTDKDGIPDVRDPDIDNDGIPNGRDPDANNNGIPNAQEIDLGGGAQSDEE